MPPATAGGVRKRSESDAGFGKRGLAIGCPSPKHSPAALGSTISPAHSPDSTGSSSTSPRMTFRKRRTSQPPPPLVLSPQQESRLLHSVPTPSPSSAGVPASSALSQQSHEAPAQTGRPTSYSWSTHQFSALATKSALAELRVGNLIQENNALLQTMTENLTSLKFTDNLDLFSKFRDNFETILAQ